MATFHQTYKNNNKNWKPSVHLRKAGNAVIQGTDHVALNNLHNLPVIYSNVGHNNSEAVITEKHFIKTNKKLNQYLRAQH